MNNKVNSNNKISNNNKLVYIIIIIILVVIVIITLNKYNEYSSTYRNINDYQFKTGDIVLTSDNGLLGYVILLLGSCNYSHCGIVIDGKKRLVAHSSILNNSKNDIMPILLIKSEINKNYDIKDSGVIIEHINTFINGNIKKLAILPIKNEIDSVKMLNTYTYYMNKPYKQSLLELINVNNNLFKNVRDDSSLFCSEFIIELLQNMNIIDKNIISNTITPDKLLDLSSHDKKKLVIINFNIDKNILINSFLYKLLSFIRLPIKLISNFISSL